MITRSALLSVYFCLALVVCGPLPATAQDPPQVSLGLSGGYRTDSLDWNIAGNFLGEDPNVLSELDWKNLDIFELRSKGTLTYSLRQGLALFGRGHLGYGRILDGKNRDSDYDFDNRTGEFSRSINDADSGEVFDALLGAGPALSFHEGRLVVAPLIGYSYHRQNLVMINLNQVIPDTGPFPGLDSSYDAQWWGPWLGVDLTLQPLPGASLVLTIERHWADYLAEADWNLRDDLQHPKSFEHQGDGDGFVLAAGGSWDLGQGLSLDLDLIWRDWKIKGGRDRFFSADGTVGGTRLNAVNWESFSALAGVTWQFD